jgi:hypothetical protein
MSIANTVPQRSQGIILLFTYFLGFRRARRGFRRAQRSILFDASVPCVRAFLNSWRPLPKVEVQSAAPIVCHERRSAFT